MASKITLVCLIAAFMVVNTIFFIIDMKRRNAEIKELEKLQKDLINVKKGLGGTFSTAKEELLALYATNNSDNNSP